MRLNGDLLALALLTTTISSGCVKREVMRSAGGHVYAGRFIQARAYEAYARGTLAEAEGRLDDAARSFRSATEFDGDGPEPWTRLGAVLCKQKDYTEAASAFDEAISADATFAAAYRERARCALSRRDLEGALASAELAAILDPEDEEAVTIHIDALMAAKKHQRAARILVARLVEGLPSPRLADRLEAVAAVLKDRALAALAAEAKARASTAIGAPVSAKPTKADIDAALARGNLASARKLATRAKTSQGEIALRAAALQRNAIALEQAVLVLDAEPTDASAAVALLVASDPAAMEASTKQARSADLRAAPPLARLLFAELLLRVDGVESARAILAADDLGATRADPLEEVVRLRVQRRINR